MIDHLKNESGHHCIFNNKSNFLIFFKFFSGSLTTTLLGKKDKENSELHVGMEIKK